MPTFPTLFITGKLDCPPGSCDHTLETYHQWRRQRPCSVRAALAPSQAELRVLHVTDEEVDRNHAHLTTLPLV